MTDLSGIKCTYQWLNNSIGLPGWFVYKSALQLAYT
jgi:hypothetical protein